VLTARQQEIWQFLVAYVDGHGYPPTVREIGESVGLASPSTVHAHLANLERAGLGTLARVVRSDALGYLRGLADADGPFDVVLLDPPYERADLVHASLELLGAEAAPLRPDAVVVAKHFWRAAPARRVGLLASVRERRFGDTALTFYRRLGIGIEDGSEA